MICIKICLFYVFLTLCKVEAELKEKGENQDNLAASVKTLPVILQLSESKQSNENEILQRSAERSAEITEKPASTKTNISNEIEVFEVKLGPQNEKQEEEEEPVDEGKEIPSDVEEPKEEPDPVAEETNTAATQTEENSTPVSEGGPAADTETTKDPPAEEPKSGENLDAPKENEQEANVEEERENVQTTEIPSPPGETATNNESEMPNDEPAKPVETLTEPSKDTIKTEVYCFACTSIEDLKCATKATKQVQCPKSNEGDAGKHNGCYTLYQADNNITMRGCVDDLAEGGLKYCLTNEKLCNLCYNTGCNDKLAPNKATKLQLSIYSLLILSACSTIIIKSVIFKF